MESAKKRDSLIKQIERDQDEPNNNNEKELKLNESEWFAWYRDWPLKPFVEGQHSLARTWVCVTMEEEYTERKNRWAGAGRIKKKHIKNKKTNKNTKSDRQVKIVETQ